MASAAAVQAARGLILVAVGQCGNQIASELWRQLEPAVLDALSSRGTLRCVHVDSEPRVVRSVASVHAERVSADDCVLDQAGRGNNWAMGANCSDSLRQRALQRVQHHAANLPVFDSLVLIYSLGGGTGSGLGSRLLADFRQRYPRVVIVAVVVAPYRSGDTPAQSYNVVLALHAALQWSDAVLMFQNDLVSTAVLHQQQKKQQGQRIQRQAPRLMMQGVSLAAVNAYIARCVALCLLTTSIPDLVASVCPLPHAKLLDAWLVEDAAVAWPELVTQLCGYQTASQSHVLAAQIVVAVPDQRGEFLWFRSAEASERLLRKYLRFLPWTQHPVDLRLYRPSRQRGIGLIVNRSSSAEYLVHVSMAARAMLEAGAFVHWYERYQCSRDEIASAISDVGRVVDFHLWLQQKQAG